MLQKYITKDGLVSVSRTRASRGIGVRYSLRLVVLGIILIGLSVGFATACSKGLAREEPGELPTYAYNSAETLSAYKSAQRMQYALPVIPCYCGCGLAHGHKSLRDCFFNQDDSFNDHASNCHVCVAEVADADAWREEGLSWERIRVQIDAKYSEYGSPTETPLPDSAEDCACGH